MEDSTFHGDCRGHDEARVHIGEVKPFPGIKHDKAQALKPLEEAAEVYGAWQQWNIETNGYFANPLSRKWAVDDLLNEIADCIQACANLAHSLGIEDMSPYMEACRERNEARGRY